MQPFFIFNSGSNNYVSGQVSFPDPGNLPMVPKDFSSFTANLPQKFNVDSEYYKFQHLLALRSRFATISENLNKDHQSEDIFQQLRDQDSINTNHLPLHIKGFIKESKKIFKQTSYLSENVTSIGTHPTNKPSNRRRRDLWKPDEDAALLQHVATIGHKWSKIASLMNNRSGKQVRDRFLNVLEPQVRFDQWTTEEDEQLIMLYHEHGKKWCKIASQMPGRSEMLVKNRFYFRLRHRAEKSRHEEKSKDETRRCTYAEYSGSEEGFEAFKESQSDENGSQCLLRDNLSNSSSHHTQYNSRDPHLIDSKIFGPHQTLYCKTDQFSSFKESSYEPNNNRINDSLSS